MSVIATLNARRSTHGDFAETARVTQQLGAAMRNSPNWSGLSDVHRESLEMIQHKIARMLCGDAWFLDSVRDILGYAQLLHNYIDSMPDDISDVATQRRVKVNGQWENYES